MKTHQPQQSSLQLPRQQRPLQPGEVALVGAGPGDPELLTVRALRLLHQADVLVYDRLVSEGILALVPEHIERHFVGKTAGSHCLPQPDINTLLVKLARQQRRVVRLKGGDPFIFGRGGEEVETLLAAGIPCQLVPGITAASACTSYSGIPLTHRDYAHGFTVVTGHLKAGELELPWSCLARTEQTLVIYMGLKNASIISQQLIAHGLPADTPIALIERGTTPEQRVYRSSLAELPQAIIQQGIKPPSLMVIGQVCSLFTEQPDWNCPAPQNNSKEYHIA